MWGFALEVPPVQLDGLLQRAVHQRCRAKIEDQAIVLDQARMLLRIHDPKAPTNHLHKGGGMGARAQQDDAAGWRVVIAFRQDGDIDHHQGVALFVLLQSGFTFAFG